MSARLEIQLFGSLQIEKNGNLVTGFISNKAAALLAYLAVTRRTHQRDALAALLWGEMAEADAKNNLRQALANLRKLAEPHLSITRDTVAFDTAVPHTVDTQLFEQHLNTSRHQAEKERFHYWQEAAALYRGDFLAGFFVRDAPEFEEWMLAQRLRYRELALHTLHTLTEHHLSWGEYGSAIDYATRLLALDAWREEAHRQLMLALARSGQRSAALAQYETCRRLLDKELGVDPSTETVALHNRIRAAGETPRHNLPPQPTPFVGRTEELITIQELLLNPACRLLTLVGTGGMGKTRLALQAAEQAHRHGLFLHGVFFVPLVGVDSVTLLVTAVATACGLNFSGSEEPTTQLFNFLREQELLLVLDNFEHLLEESTWLARLLQETSGVKLLVTSRETLNVQWERSLPLTGLTVPPTEASSPSEATKFSAVQLFLSRARQVRPDWEINSETLPCLTQICQLVAGMPLALELAATTIRHYSCAEIAQTITHNLDILATTYRDMPPRHRSLRAVFDNVWPLLTPEAQALFAALSVFVGSFSLDAAEKVCGATRSGLAALVDKSLLYRLENGRYQLHNVLRQYAAQQLEPSQQHSLGQNHARFYMSALQQHEKRLFTTAEAEAFQAIQTDLGNIRLAWSWALAQRQLELLAQGLKSLRTFYNSQSRFQEGADWLAQTAVALESLLAVDEVAVVQALYGKVLARRASFAAWMGQRELAESLFQQALPLVRQLDDPEELGFLLLNKGYLNVLSGVYEMAGQEFQESLANYRRTEDARGIADALSALGAWHNITGDWQQARLHLEESVAIARQLQDEHGLRSSLTNLGNVYYLLKEFTLAKTHYEEVLPLCQKVGDRASEAVIYSNLGALAQEAGDFVQAEQSLQRGMKLFAESNHNQAVIHAQTMLAAVYRQAARFEEARQVLYQALQQAIRQKYDYLIPMAIFEIGMLYAATNQESEALPLLLWVMAHPSAQAENRLEAEKVVADLQAELAAKQVEVAKLTGASLEVTAVLAAINNSL
ncbi:MAG: tetratricopeptide repeat protein [Ardenticatenaceae bacterium]|nr:tetratricopeptide repeat protein [Ardenticatenaceae bacterium]